MESAPTEWSCESSVKHTGDLSQQTMSVHPLVSGFAAFIAINATTGTASEVIRHVCVQSNPCVCGLCRMTLVGVYCPRVVGHHVLVWAVQTRLLIPRWVPHSRVSLSDSRAHRLKFCLSMLLAHVSTGEPPIVLLRVTGESPRTPIICSSCMIVLTTPSVWSYLDKFGQ